MVMFFPMVKLAIHGYEVLILSLASPIILGPSLVNTIAQVELLVLIFLRISHTHCCSHIRVLLENYLFELLSSLVYYHFN